MWHFYNTSSAKAAKHHFKNIIDITSAVKISLRPFIVCMDKLFPVSVSIGTAYQKNYQKDYENTFSNNLFSIYSWLWTLVTPLLKKDKYQAMRFFHNPATTNVLPLDL